jgi:pyruvate dehydrogenase E1 component alpha subunit
MITTGAALAFRNRGEDRVALTWVDEAATKTTAAHEGMNFAAVQNVPAVFVIQNNQIAAGVRMERRTPGDVGQWPATYGIQSWQCDGNNVLDVYACVRLAVASCREGRGPAAVVADTFRMGGHGASDEEDARRLFPPEIFEAWGRRDPIGLFEAYLLGEGIPSEVLERVEKAVTGEVDRAAEEAIRSADGPTPNDNALYEGFSEGGVLVGLSKRPV